MRLFKLLLLLTLILFVSCAPKGKKEREEKKKVQASNNQVLFKNLANTLEVESFDHTTNPVKQGAASVVSSHAVLLPLDIVKQAFSARFSFRKKPVKPMAKGYLAYDIEKNLVLLKVSGPELDTVEWANTIQHKDNYLLQVIENKLVKKKVELLEEIQFDSSQIYLISSDLPSGFSVFDKAHKLIGISHTVELQGKPSRVLIPKACIRHLLATASERPLAIGKLRFKSNKKYAKPNKVKGFMVTTPVGSFAFKVYEDMPYYERNLIRLVSDGYYDSLLVHRVLDQFLLQTGAADSRNAEKGDPLGWKGPGYTLDTRINNKYIHKRGAIAASKPPAYKNERNRTDAAQFYIITGRKVTDAELTEIEERKDFKYTEHQKNLYHKLGGAPYLDRDYVVFGEIISGLEVVDKITKVPTDKNERPLVDIRILSVKLIF